jgi:hypothetical protein
MELDDLKDIWQKDKVSQLYSEAQLTNMLRGSSNSIVAKLKKSVWFELIFTLVAGVGFLIYALLLPTGAFKWITASILFLFVVYAIYYIKKLLLLNRFENNEENLKTNLERLLANLTAYLKFYKGSYTVLYPVYFGLGILFGALEIGRDNFMIRATDPMWLILLFGVAIGFFVISMMFAKWYFKQLYGNHIDKLKELLRDLNSEE